MQSPRHHYPIFTADYYATLHRLDPAYPCVGLMILTFNQLSLSVFLALSRVDFMISLSMTQDQERQYFMTLDLNVRFRIELEL